MFDLQWVSSWKRLYCKSFKLAGSESKGVISEHAQQIVNSCEQVVSLGQLAEDVESVEEATVVTCRDQVSKVETAEEIPIDTVIDQSCIEETNELDDKSQDMVRSDHSCIAKLGDVSCRLVGLATTSDSDNRLIIPASLGMHQLNILVDTGATHSMVRESWLKEKDIAYSPVCSRSIRGFGVDNVIEVSGQVALYISLGGVILKSCQFQVVKVSQASNVPIIVGEGFLRDNQLSVDLTRRRLRHTTDDGGIVDVYSGNNTEPSYTIYTNIACVVEQACDVSAMEIQKVPLAVKVDSLLSSAECYLGGLTIGPILFEPLEKGGVIQVLPGVVSSRQFEVLAIATGDIPKHLEKGAVVGRISSIVSTGDPKLSGEALVAGLQGSADKEDSEYTQGALGLIALTDYLSAEEKTRVLSLLNRHAGVFSRDNSEVGYLDILQHKIELLDSTPIYQKPRRFPEPVASDIATRCEELQLLDIIEPSLSAWSSPVVPVRKKDGTMRLCVDYRRLNAVTKPDRYPLPNLNDSVYSLYGMSYFTSLDVTRGFYHIPIEESSRELTAFSTQSGHWQFKRMPFGLRNAPSAFQRAMQVVLSKFSRGNVIVYIDDVLIMSPTFEEHLQLVGKVLATWKSMV